MGCEGICTVFGTSFWFLDFGPSRVVSCGGLADPLAQCLETTFHGERTVPFGVVGCGGQVEPLAQCLPTTLSLVLMWGPSGTSGPMSSERGCALLIVV
jgi:hypothetical protein